MVENHKSRERRRVKKNFTSFGYIDNAIQLRCNWINETAERSRQDTQCQCPFFLHFDEILGIFQRHAQFSHHAKVIFFAR